MIVLTHPTANQFVRYTAEGLYRNNLLKSFYTSLACFEGDLLYQLGGIKFLSELRRRTFDSDLKPIIKTQPYYELIRQLSIKFGWNSLTRHEFGKYCVDSIYREQDIWVSKNLKYEKSKGSKSVYAYEDAALNTFIAAKQLGMTCYYDLSIGYWKLGAEIMENEKQRRPEYASTLTGLLNSEEKLVRKDEELTISDNIIVASTFTKNSLKYFPYQLNNIKVIPYGFPPVNLDEGKKPKKQNEPLKVLFVGGLTQRKGIAEVFDSVKKFGKHIQLTVIGKKTTMDCKAVNDNLSIHNWIPSLSHQEILKQMQQHDLLLFPSLFEGFGMVITEAMSQGTPVITTNRTGATDFIINEKNGWLVEPGNTLAIIEILEDILKNPDKLNNIGEQAKYTALQRPWSKYSSEIADFVRNNNY